MVFPFHPFLSLSPELEALPSQEQGAEGAETALSCVHPLIRAFLSPCQSREAGSKPAPGQGFVMRRSYCNRSRTLGHLDVHGATSSSEGMGSTRWEQGAGSGARKRDAHPSWLTGPRTDLPFNQKFSSCHGGTFIFLDIGEDLNSVAQPLSGVLCSQNVKTCSLPSVVFSAVAKLLVPLVQY